MASTGYSEQSTSEIVTYTIDYTNDLPVGAAISSVAVTHTPPSGGTVTVPSVGVSSPDVSVQAGPLVNPGRHTLTVLATFDNGDKSEFELSVQVG